MFVQIIRMVMLLSSLDILCVLGYYIPSTSCITTYMLLLDSLCIFCSTVCLSLLGRLHNKQALL